MVFKKQLGPAYVHKWTSQIKSTWFRSLWSIPPHLRIVRHCWASLSLVQKRRKPIYLIDPSPNTYASYGGWPLHTHTHLELSVTHCCYSNLQVFPRHHLYAWSTYQTSAQLYTSNNYTALHVKHRTYNITIDYFHYHNN